jgi:putative transposase
MARLARIVIPKLPHHIVQRGNRKQRTFFSEHDKATYLDILGKNIAACDLKLWAYCLMTNHVHLIAVPGERESLAQAIGGTHQEYSNRINRREGWTGYLWQGRFYSCPLDEPYLFMAIRYVENNPVRSGIVRQAEDYAWSSAKAHVLGSEDVLLSDFSLKSRVLDWRAYLREGIDSDNEEIRRHFRTGRPLGDGNFIARLEALTGRSLTIKKSGPKGPWKNRATNEN